MTCIKKESDWKEYTTWYVQTEGKMAEKVNSRLVVRLRTEFSNYDLLLQGCQWLNTNLEFDLKKNLKLVHNGCSNGNLNNFPSAVVWL